MNVQKLIEQLKTFPPDAMIAVASFEGGFNEVLAIKKIELAVNRKQVIDDSTHHLANWAEIGADKSVVAICIGPVDPGAVSMESTEGSRQRG